MPCMSELSGRYLCRDNNEKFGLWAYGEKYNELSHTLEFMNEWNKLHGSKFMLLPTGFPTKDIIIMIDLWWEEVNLQILRNQSVDINQVMPINYLSHKQT